MPSLHSLVVRRASPMDMGTAASSVTAVNPHSKTNSSPNSKKMEKNSKLSGIRLPLLRKDTSTISLSPAEKTANKNGGEAPLLRPESSASLEVRGNSWVNLGPTALRKCETAVGLSTLTLEGRPVNRSRVCSRCSSLLSLASGSRYSLAGGSFVPAASSQQQIGRLLCKLCLTDVISSETFSIEDCGCSYCKDCMNAYVEFEIEEGAYDISCPDAKCDQDGMLSMKEIKTLVSEELLEKHKKFRLNRDVSMDKDRAWCPRAGCETICSLNAGEAGAGSPSGPVHCPSCATDFCYRCREPWHTGPCPETPLGIPFDSDHIKCCPMCSVPIEKDEGCAQMMCKRCKHVFCWYCLASLDDDFLLRHYDKGPCKNKLGHSRASVIWHRTQVIGIFAGFGLLLLVASPLLLLAAPCIVCCKCRVCGSSRLDQDDAATATATTTLVSGAPSVASAAQTTNVIATPAQEDDATT
ncbi:E3 ubiquitin-protein ligase RNF144A [Trichogramma pretiosum]|uniref:E3 ubiquitin-protein ligase RNF144A n=1 Tax=Trichogramma pretiosum TaxID=7493 RepID=UPI0006C9A540|nr:E3 ubiquitin-protein ligase RNF144A [Trichogramma pretiosum]XP_014222593.1 E3 ubiquitin-protein ligase RNF144A [Trichogramma pretiosum]XP_023315188.1 E3 ubiquitin-protein ligase RNF144A [Trichogramma pretiosum]XP_023315189.1 E3 ubiquitin-protein ligase RNF144A [Trichogramma pretiosum]